MVPAAKTKKKNEVGRGRINNRIKSSRLLEVRLKQEANEEEVSRVEGWRGNDSGNCCFFSVLAFDLTKVPSV